MVEKLPPQEAVKQGEPTAPEQKGTGIEPVVYNPSEEVRAKEKEGLNEVHTRLGEQQEAEAAESGRAADPANSDEALKNRESGTERITKNPSEEVRASGKGDAEDAHTIAEEQREAEAAESGRAAANTAPTPPPSIAKSALNSYEKSQHHKGGKFEKYFFGPVKGIFGVSGSWMMQIIKGVPSMAGKGGSGSPKKKDDHGH